MKRERVPGRNPTAGGVPLPAWDPAQSQNLMDQVGIGTAILSISSPGVHFGDDSAARDLSRQSNEFCAEVISDNPSRFGAFAVLPLPDVNSSLKEAEYALDTLKLDGVVMLASQSDGTFLGDKNTMTCWRNWTNARQWYLSTRQFIPRAKICH